MSSMMASSSRPCTWSTVRYEAPSLTSMTSMSGPGVMGAATNSPPYTASMEAASSAAMPSVSATPLLTNSHGLVLSVQQLTSTWRDPPAKCSLSAVPSHPSRVHFQPVTTSLLEVSQVTGSRNSSVGGSGVEAPVMLSRASRGGAMQPLRMVRHKPSSASPTLQHVGATPTAPRSPDPAALSSRSYHVRPSLAYRQPTMALPAGHLAPRPSIASSDLPTTRVTLDGLDSAQPRAFSNAAVAVWASSTLSMSFDASVSPTRTSLHSATKARSVKGDISVWFVLGEPGVAATSAAHVNALAPNPALPCSERDVPLGVLVPSLTPMSVDCTPSATPPTPVRLPSYVKN
mmetsp:Transcript_29168/g.72100  ORF Transcript_29168/g.72100 Transcript_29168/m.72100 type:complete len:345 (-) Transcript_29168:1829-2863(-)